MSPVGDLDDTAKDTLPFGARHIHSVARVVGRAGTCSGVGGDDRIGQTVEGTREPVDVSATERLFTGRQVLGKASGVPIKELYQLFPKGPAKLAAKIGGIPKPRGCI